MVQNDIELATTLERIQRLQDQLTVLRKLEANPVIYRLSSSGFIAEIDRLQLEASKYLDIPATQTGSI